MNEMTKEEMQRFLNREAEKGSTEYEALKALADILGIEFPELKQKEKAEYPDSITKKGAERFAPNIFRKEART